MKKSLLALLFAVTAPVVAAAEPEKPKLIVQITVDQLRGDLLTRYQNNFVDRRWQRGFKRFLEDGTLYTNAHYRHSATLTAVGHATLATGAIPSQHGLVSNGWYDRASASNMYCVADKNVSLLGAEGYSASAANLTASTFSDELYLATNGKAKVFAVSIKDRGAVLTGGHKGKSFWYDKKTGNMVTSSYYYEAMPAFADEFNQAGHKDAYLGKTWSLMQDEGKYLNDDSNQLFQMPPKGFNLGFPHKIADQANADYYSMLTFTPFGDELTARFAKHIISTQDLGDDEITDYLSISFSVNDYVGHRFGPYSREAEDNLLHLDRTMADLFAFLDKEIGLQHVLVVLSADHGVDAIPEYKKQRTGLGFRAKADEDIQAAAAELAASMNIEGNLIEKLAMPDVYLNHKLLSGHDIAQVAKQLKARIENVEGIAFALTAQELAEQNLQHHPIKAKVQNGFFPERAGDLVVVQQRSTMLNSYSAATHGSPYNYDTYVPVYFTGWKVPEARVDRLTSPEDIAVTLSAVMGITPPDKATGSVLPEILVDN